MRPKLLEIEGLQSFIDKQTIDFNALNQNGLFGIFGNTGSGKSTILDAITLALYGKVKRAGNTKQGIINTSCNLARVTFVFEIAGITYRVEREYKRKKASENLVESRLVRLIQVEDDNLLPLCDKEEAVNRKIEDILGLNHKDFTKAVVLPQNNFQEFLLLGNSERRQMLERVFYLEEYGKELMSKIGDKITLLKKQRDDIYIELKGYEEASNEAVAEYKNKLKETLSKKDASDKKLEYMQKEYDAQKEVYNLNKELEAIVAKEDKLIARDSEVIKMEEKLEKSDRADLLKEKLEQIKKLRADMCVVKKKVEEYDKELPTYINANVALNEKYEKLKGSMEHRSELYDNVSLENSIETLKKEIKIIERKEKKENLEIEGQELEYKKNAKDILAKNKEYDELKKNEIENMCLFIAKDLEDGCKCPVCGGIYSGKTKEEANFEDIDINGLNNLSKDITDATVRQERIKTMLKMKKEHLEEYRKERLVKQDELNKKNILYRKILDKYNIKSISSELESMKAKDKMLDVFCATIKENEKKINDKTNEKVSYVAKFNTYNLQYETMSKEFVIDMKEKGFDKSKDIVESLLDKEDKQNIKEEIEKHKKEKLELLGQKKSIQDKLRGRTITDEKWKEMHEKYLLIVEENKKLTTQYGIEKNRYETSVGKNEKWNILSKEYNKTELEYRKHEELRDLLNGDRGKDNSFIDYIAEERLRYLAKRASSILGVMTQYRFELKLDAESGFRIVDNKNAGVSRKVNTLSGGETFLTSLALALALSEQIQLKGQSPLEFFFLDEGFGSLDNELLDLVIDALERISKKERIIGVISHIPELRQRIMQRVIVTGPVDNETGSVVAIERG